MTKFSAICLAGIIALSIALRFYFLGSVPNGLYQDETAIGYNAYSILQTGKDEHGLGLPQYFQSFGDWKLPVYIYSTVPSVYLFGLTPFAVRLPAAIFGVLSVLAMYFFTRRLTKKEDLALLSAFFLSIAPWHLHYSRATFEVSISLFLYLAGGYLILRAIQDRRYGFFILGTILFILNLYTYNLTRLLTPLIYALFLVFNYRDIRKMPNNYLFGTALVILVGSVPFLLGLLGRGGAGSASGTLIHTSASIQSDLLEYRSYLLLLPEIFVKAFFNKWIMTAWVYLEHVASYFSVPFLFLTGSPHGNHGIGNVGQFYLFMLPFFLVGIFQAIVSKSREYYFLFSFSLVCILVAGLTRESPHATRSFFLLIPFTIFISLGAVAIYKYASNLKPLVRYGIFTFVALISIYNIVYYFTSYYVNFPVSYAASWRSEDKKLADILDKISGNYKKIIIDKSTGNIYTSLLFYGSYPPEKFQESAVFEPPDSEGFVGLSSFDKYEFRNIDWEKDRGEGILFVTTEKNLPKGSSVIETLSFPSRPIVSAVGQDIISYPVEETAYVIAVSN